MGLPISFSVDGSIAPDRDGVSAAQSVGAAGNLLINGALASGGVATVAPAGQEASVAVYSAGDNTGVLFTAEGTNASGNPISSSTLGANADRNSFPINYRTVTRVYTDAATVGDVEVGSVANYSAPASFNYHAQPVNITLQADVVGTANFTLQVTAQELNTWPAPDSVLWLPHADFTSKSADIVGLINYPIAYARLLLNSGTGTVNATALQAGITGG